MTPASIQSVGLLESSGVSHREMDIRSDTIKDPEQYDIQKGRAGSFLE